MPKQSFSNASLKRIRPLVATDLNAVVDLSLLAWEPVFQSFETILGTPIFDRIYRPDARTAQAANVSETCLADDVEAFVAVTVDDEVAGFVALRTHTDAEFFKVFETSGR
ncbi:MAG: hypothetical protein M3451_10105 [Chloroflexota bacterium]|nr:hypothetical protein [Chloroflexota bacterium]